MCLVACSLLGIIAQLRWFVKRFFILESSFVCVVNRCDPLDEKMPEIRYNVL